MMARTCDRPGCTSKARGNQETGWYMIGRRRSFPEVAQDETLDACSESCAVYVVEMLGENTP